MKKNNTNKGITLIALVITIIVMLILVAVTISMAVNGGLFEYASNAGAETNAAIANEQELGSGKVTIGSTTYNSIDEYLGTSGGSQGSGDTLPTYANAEKTNGVLTAKATYTTTENGKTYTAVIPKGFAVSKIEDEQTIVNGLVITDKVDNEGNSVGNEFVWIPVSKAIVTEAEIAKIREEDSTITTDLAAVQKMVNSGIYPMAVEVNTKDAEGNVTATNYKGILYTFRHDATTNVLTLTVSDWNTSHSSREPANLDGEKTFSAGTTVNGTTLELETKYKYDSQEMFNLYGGGTYTSTLYQDSYNKMIKSVADNGGFYVGRYEISNEGNLDYAETKKDKTALVSTTWYEMYKLERAYAEKNTDLGVTSEMIWGSQWDQMMIFVNGKNDGAAIPAPFYVKKSGSRYSNDSSTKTGMNTKGDEVANIFDLEASRYEWTQEACGSYGRVYRGGSWEYSGTAGDRPDYGEPSFGNSIIDSSRATLYVK